MFLASFAAVMGPMAYLQHLLSGPRLPFTAAYFGSIIMTFYFSLGVSNCPASVSLACVVFSPSIRLTRVSCLDKQLHSTFLTLISALIQMACLVWYLVSYFPMGSSGLRLATTFGARRAAAWMTG